MSTHQRTLAIDYDGTIVDFEFPKAGTPKPGVKEALTFFKQLGYHILIYSCRTCHWHYDVFGGDPSLPIFERQKVKDMIRVLDENEIPYDEVDDGAKGKPLAELYIDDKGYRFTGDWAAAANFVWRTLGPAKGVEDAYAPPKAA